MTRISKSEQELARAFRKKNFRFRQQHKIGIYTVDFFLPPNVVVEVEGFYHDSPQRLERDRQRQEYLEKRGYYVFRFTTKAVKNDPSNIASLLVQYVGKKKTI